MSDSVREVIILGSGPAGLTAAIYTARANLKPLIANGAQPGGQLTTTTDVENYPGFSDGIMGPALMEEMEKQAVRFGAEILPAAATKVELGNGAPFTVHFGDRTEQTKSLIIATGAKARTMGLEREWELMGYGVSTCATCDGAFFREQEIIVVGGGDSAAEEANFLTKFGKRVRLIHRRNELRASKIMQERVFKNPKIEVVWNTVVTELLGDRKDGVTGVVVENVDTKEKSRLECNAVFYAIGHVPNTELFKGMLNMDENGYLITKPDSTKTNVPGVFACGDVQDHVFRQAVTAAGSGCMAAIETERYLAEHE